MSKFIFNFLRRIITKPRDPVITLAGAIALAAISKVVSTTFVNRSITNSATKAAAETHDTATKNNKVDSITIGTIGFVVAAPPVAGIAAATAAARAKAIAADAIGRAAATNVTAPPAVGLAAATAAGTGAGLSETTAASAAKAACSAAAEKFSALAVVTPVATITFAVIGALAGYYVANRLNELETEIVNSNVNNEARFANIERNIELMLSARSQTHIHNLDSMEHSALVDLLTCPITLELINDPVYMNDERFYERSAITSSFAINNVSPVNPDVILEDPDKISTHRQVKNFLDANRERLLSKEKDHEVLRNSSSAARQIGFISGQSTEQPLHTEVRPGFSKR